MWTPAELAARLVKRFRDRGLNPKVEAGPDGSDVIRFLKLSVDADPPRPDEVAELAKLRPLRHRSPEGQRNDLDRLNTFGDTARSASQGQARSTSPQARPS